jgi:type IV fimbrial biogenesis protein FimT
MDYKNIGTTLVELMVVLTIVIILTMISIPLFTSFLQNYRLKAETENLFNTLQYARTEAIKRNSNIYLSFTTGDSWCYGMNTNSACNCNIANNCNLGATSFTKPQQLSLSTTGMSGNSLYFESIHAFANSSSSATFSLYGQSNSITINIGRSGSLQLCSNSISGYSTC